MRIKTGTYTGDGAATQAIVGVGFQPKLVIIHKQIPGQNVYDQGWKTSSDGINTMFVQADAGFRYGDDHIISLDADGFTVGDGTGWANVFNINAIDYAYIAFT